MQRSGGSGRPVAPRQRGMVTVELAVGAVTATLVTGCLVSLSMLGVAQATCAEVAAQIARQGARGDVIAEAQARERAPERARVKVDRDDQGVEAEVSLPVGILGLGDVTVSAAAWAAYEPGVGR